MARSLLFQYYQGGKPPIVDAAAPADPPPSGFLSSPIRRRALPIALLTTFSAIAALEVTAAPQVDVLLGSVSQPAARTRKIPGWLTNSSAATADDEAIFSSISSPRVVKLRTVPWLSQAPPEVAGDAPFYTPQGFVSQPQRPPRRPAQGLQQAPPEVAVAAPVDVPQGLLSTPRPQRARVAWLAQQPPQDDAQWLQGSLSRPANRPRPRLDFQQAPPDIPVAAPVDVPQGWLSLPARRTRRPLLWAPQTPPDIVVAPFTETPVGWLSMPRAVKARPHFEPQRFPPETPATVVVTFTPTQGAPGIPATRNRMFWRLPDLGTLHLRSDRLTGAANEAQIRAVEGMEEDYEMTLPGALPASTRAITVDAQGAMSYGTGELSATATWNPGSLNNGDKDSTTVTVTGAAIGDPVDVGFSQAVPSGMVLRGDVTSANTVTVTLFNISAGAAQDLASGTLTVTVVKV